MIIVIDDREKQPFEFPGVDTETARLETGDYTVKGFENEFAVERKSLDDLARSVGTGRSKFEAEIRRAQQMNNFAVVIESSRRDAQAGNYYSQIHPNAVILTVDKLPMKHRILEFLLANNPDQAAQETLQRLDRWCFKSVSNEF